MRGVDSFVTLMSAAVLGGEFFAMADLQSLSVERLSQQYGTARDGKKTPSRFDPSHGTASGLNAGFSVLSVNH